jgi:anthranilate/para-aminobenzoate synthase component II
MKRAFLIDFDDSFTFNVVQELARASIQCEVIHWLDFEDLPDDGLLILGPGPGHPDDYQRIFPLVLKWLKGQKPFFGICLGHQILWRLMGEDVVRSKEPLHGQRMKLELTDEWKQFLELSDEAWVQRYNSLTVLSQAGIRNPQFTNFIQNEEILITRGERLLTYQFHPESVGTSFRQAYFMPILRYLV